LWAEHWEATTLTAKQLLKLWLASNKISIF
jgi:hypothetical protein